MFSYYFVFKNNSGSVIYVTYINKFQKLINHPEMN